MLGKSQMQEIQDLKLQGSHKSRDPDVLQGSGNETAQLS